MFTPPMGRQDSVLIGKISRYKSVFRLLHDPETIKTRHGPHLSADGKGNAWVKLTAGARIRHVIAIPVLLRECRITFTGLQLHDLPPLTGPV